MTMKKCNKCGIEEDFSENPLCDKCATETYSNLLLFNLIGELQKSNLKPVSEKKRIINKLKNIKWKQIKK